MSNGGVATISGVLFGPNGSGKSYISLYSHRGTGSSRYKHQWVSLIPPLMEFSIFCTADTANWRDPSGHYWGLYNSGATVLGTRGERLCKFPKNTNENNPWHGYPVSPREDGDKDAPPDMFVENWIAHGVVSKIIGRRIQRRKV